MTFQRSIYFLRPVGQKGPIKIGSSQVPKRRLQGYQIWSPVLLEIAATCPAHRNTEVFLHRHFYPTHMHGEWFVWSDELQRLIDHVEAFGVVPEWVDAPTNPKEWKDMRAKYPRGLSRSHPKQAA